MNSTRSKETKGVIVGMGVICKCIHCKDAFSMEGVTLDITDVLDPSGEFSRYNVKIAGPLGPIHPETEICGPPYRMSMYGVMSSGAQFAFPCLAWSAIRDSNLWLSNPDSKGNHLAIKPAPDGGS